MADNNLDLALISTDVRLCNYIEEVCGEYGYEFTSWTNEDEFMEDLDSNQFEARCILLDAREYKEETIAPNLQVARQMCPNSFIATVIGKKISREVAAFCIKSGSDVMLQEHELKETSKLDFFLNHSIRGEYIPIKTSELQADTEFMFNVYHYAATRKKYLVCGHEGLFLTAAKFDKMKKFGEFYIKRGDLEKFVKYVNTTSYKDGDPLARRSRAKFLQLNETFAKLMITITDFGRKSSFKEGKDLLQRAKDLCTDLMNSLVGVVDVWQVINQRVFSRNILLDSVPEVTAYSGLFALKADIENIEAIMTAAILSNISLITYPIELMDKISKEGIDSLESDELSQYHDHPNRSLGLLLDAKLPVDTKMREIILSIHERADSQGFPAKKSALKIPIESSVVQFAENYHLGSLVGEGEKLITSAEYNEKIGDSEDYMTTYPTTFLKMIKRMLKTPQ